jgi:hypothetical protein
MAWSTMKPTVHHRIGDNALPHGKRQLTQGPEGRAMRQVQIIKQPRRSTPESLDLRTPSGRVLPY